MAEIPLAKPRHRVWITEFHATSNKTAAAPIARLPALRKHPPLDLALGVQQAVLDKRTGYIRIVSEVDCAYSTTDTATADDIFLPRLFVEYMLVPGGQTVSVIEITDVV